MSGTPSAARDERAPCVDPALYDLVYSWYDSDLAFYRAAARAARGPVLEAACGTGRVLLPIRADGVDIDGFDREPAMIRHLERKAAERGLDVHARVQDLRDFTMPRRYALIIIPFRAFMHLTTTDEQLAALTRVREHLAPEGALLFNLFYPSFAFMKERAGQRILEREFLDPASGRNVQLWDTTRYDIVNQAMQADRDVELRAPDGTLEVHRYGFELRWSFRFELELLLRVAGFSRWDVRGGFDGRPLEREADEMVWTAVVS